MRIPIAEKLEGTTIAFIDIHAGKNSQSRDAKNEVQQLLDWLKTSKRIRAEVADEVVEIIKATLKAQGKKLEAVHLGKTAGSHAKLMVPLIFSAHTLSQLEELLPPTSKEQTTRDIELSENCMSHLRLPELERWKFEASSEGVLLASNLTPPKVSKKTETPTPTTEPPSCIQAYQPVNLDEAPNVYSTWNEVLEDLKQQKQELQTLEKQFKRFKLQEAEHLISENLRLLSQDEAKINEIIRKEASFIQRLKGILDDPVSSKKKLSNIVNLIKALRGFFQTTGRSEQREFMCLSDQVKKSRFIDVIDYLEVLEAEYQSQVTLEKASEKALRDEQAKLDQVNREERAALEVEALKKILCEFPVNVEALSHCQAESRVDINALIGDSPISPSKLMKVITDLTKMGKKVSVNLELIEFDSMTEDELRNEALCDWLKNTTFIQREFQNKIQPKLTRNFETFITEPYSRTSIEGVSEHKWWISHFFKPKALQRIRSEVNKLGEVELGYTLLEEKLEGLKTHGIIDTEEKKAILSIDQTGPPTNRILTITTFGQKIMVKRPNPNFPNTVIVEWGHRKNDQLDGEDLYSSIETGDGTTWLEKKRGTFEQGRFTKGIRAVSQVGDNGPVRVHGKGTWKNDVLHGDNCSVEVRDPSGQLIEEKKGQFEADLLINGTWWVKDVLEEIGPRCLSSQNSPPLIIRSQQGARPAVEMNVTQSTATTVLSGENCIRRKYVAASNSWREDKGRFKDGIYEGEGAGAK